VEIFVSDLADEAAEQQRQAKRCEELKKQIAAMKGRVVERGVHEEGPAALGQADAGPARGGGSGSGEAGMRVGSAVRNASFVPRRNVPHSGTYFDVFFIASTTRS
jgi:hypothetical protein